jgi:hypothetical protein
MGTQLIIAIFGTILFSGVPTFYIYCLILKHYKNWATISKVKKFLTIFLWILASLGTYFFLDFFIDDILKLDKILLIK